MESPAVILMETGQLQLTNISRHCLLHTVNVLRPQHNLSIVLPKSGSHKIESFCMELLEAVLVKPSQKKVIALLPEEPLIPSIEVHRFCEGATSMTDFALVVEEKFLSVSKGNINLDAFHRCCWKYYEMERKSEISFPKWFSRECTYRLWLIYNCVLDCDLDTALPLRTANEVMKRIVELCGYTWNQSYMYQYKEKMTYPEYLQAITTYFEKFKLETSLTCEVIGDMVDEIVHGVLKTGKLTKKGHKRKNWKRRWFVLQRTTLRYYESRDSMALKGQLVLNSRTEVKSMPDRGKKKFCFQVTCGHTGKPFEITADNQRSKHEWMLAIKKAIALARVLDGSSQQEDFSESLAGFYLLKYGTPQPHLSRQDSTVRKMKFQATLKNQRRRLSGRKDVVGYEADDTNRGLSDDQDEYLPMSPVGDISSDDSSAEDEDQYTPMHPVAEEFLDSYDSTISCSPEITQSLPPGIPVRLPSDRDCRLSGSFSGPIRTTYQDRPSILEPTPERDEELDEESDSYDSVTIGEDGEIKNRGFSNAGLLSAVDTGKDGSYIHLVSDNRAPSLPPRSNSPSSPELNKELISSLTLESPNNWTERDAPPSPNLYLTLLPSDPKDIHRTYTEPGVLSPTKPSSRNGPPVPPHRRSPSLEAISPVVSPTHFRDNVLGNAAEVRGFPPTPPPRSKTLQGHVSSPTLHNDPPPLPSRHILKGGSPLSPPTHHDLSSRSSECISASSPSDNPEHANLKRTHTQNGNYYVRDPTSAPPLPPR